MTGLGGLSNYRGNHVDSGAHGPLTGLAAGFDAALGRYLTLGIGGGEANPEVVLDDADDRTRTHMFQLGVYGRFRNAQSRIDGGSTSAHRTTAPRAWFGCRLPRQHLCG